MAKEVMRKPAPPSHGSGPVKSVDHMHPLHKEGVDHRDMSMSDKVLGNGPSLPMPKHQNPLHHPHTDVSEKHKAPMKKGY